MREKNRPFIPAKKAKEASTLHRTIRARRELNWPLAIGTLIAIIVLVPSAWGWHAWQIGRQSRFLLSRSVALENESKPTEALRMLERYLVLNPEDIQSRLRHTKLYDSVASSPGQKNVSLENHARLIGLMPDDLDLKIRYAELLLEQNSPVSASQTAEAAISKSPRNARALVVLAKSLLSLEQAGGRTSPAAKVRTACEQAILENPNDVGLTVSFASYLRGFTSAPDRRQLERFADSLMDRMVDNNANSVKAIIARYLYRTRFHLPNTDVDLDLAMNRFADDPEVLVLQAHRLAEKGQADAAIAMYRQAIGLRPDSRAAYAGLARLHRSAKRFPDAVATLNEGLEAVDKNDLSLSMELAQTLIEQGSAQQAEDVIDRLNRSFASIASQIAPSARVQVEIILAMLEGDYARSKGNLRKALAHYEHALRRFTVTGNNVEQYQQQVQLLQLCAQIHGHFDEWDRTALVYRRLVALEPAEYRWRLQLGVALQQGGQWADASDALRSAVQLENCPPQAWFDFARANLISELAKPVVDRSWILFQEAFEHVQQTFGDGFHANLLQGQFLIAKSDLVGGVEALKKSEQYLDKVSPAECLLLAEVYRKVGRDADVVRIAGMAGTSESTSYETILLEIEDLWRSGSFDAARQRISEGLKTLKADDQRTRLVVALAQLELSNGNAVEAERILVEEAAKLTENHEPLETLATMYRMQKRWADHQAVVAKLQTLEGAEGCLWREASILQLLQQDPTGDKLQAAQRMVEDVRKLRPGWARTHLLRASLAEANGRTREATDALETAYRYGATDPETFEKLIRFLTSQNRLTDAQAFAEKYANRWPALHRTSSPYAMTPGAQTGAQAIEEARKTLAGNPSEWLAHQRLAQLLLFGGRFEESAEVYEKATAVFPTEPDAWLGLFSASLSAGNGAKAEEVLQHITTNNLLPANRLHLTLAQAYELLGKTDEGEMHYLEALRQTPYDRVALRLAVKFFSRLDSDRAESALRSSIELTSDNSGAKRALAAVLAAKGGEENWQKAIDLLQESGETPSLAGVANLRLQAVLYARRGSARHRETAVRILEDIVKTPSQATAGDYLLLFGLYRDAGKIAEATTSIREAIGRDGANLSLKAGLAEYLLTTDRFAEALQELEALEFPAKELPIFLAIGARVSEAEGDHAKAVSAAEQILALVGKDSNAANQRVLRESAATVFERINEPARAEALYREIVENDQANKRALVAYLLRANRPNDAISLALTQDPKLISRDDFVLLCSLVSFADPLAEYRDRVNQVISEGLIRWGEDPTALFAVATLAYMRGQTDQAVSLMDRLLKIRPDDIAAMNNMALFLSETPNRQDQALAIIGKAIELAGPQPNLMDTLGLVQMELDRLDQAVQSFSEAIVQERSPHFHLHLAEARRRLGDMDQAAKDYESAQQLGLKDQPLNLNDQEMDRALSSLAASKTPSPVSNKPTPQ